jgi:hypothetical protein
LNSVSLTNNNNASTGSYNSSYDGESASASPVVRSPDDQDPNALAGGNAVAEPNISYGQGNEALGRQESPMIRMAYQHAARMLDAAIDYVKGLKNAESRPNAGSGGGARSPGASTPGAFTPRGGGRAGTEGAPGKRGKNDQAVLDALTAHGSEAFEKYFGKLDPQRYDHVLDTLTKMKKAMSEPANINLLGQGNDRWEGAHVMFGDKDHNINIRPHVFDNYLGKNTPEAVLLHELSHFSDVGGTRDIDYGDVQAREMARSRPNDAVENAENYGLFLKQFGDIA